eukprot:TRINITY_DN24732_c0_g1_i1.p1 TRINITY_DN24732_c0_g1~~TRINITY_DN24732_c0_g1_i1.p1  ORF type:complete len:456 (-),score=125.61 TRINITY_DN24732_c0_g1_i1:214-1581(-)
MSNMQRSNSAPNTGESEGGELKKSGSFWDQMMTAIGFGEEEDQASTAASSDRGGKGPQKGGPGAPGGGSHAGGAPGRRKSVWDSMREIVTGEETEGFDEEGNPIEPETWKNKVLVTGAEGFIAGHIVKILLEKGFSVLACVRSLRSTSKHSHLKKLCPDILSADPSKLELVEADLSRTGSYEDHVQNVEYVIHVASPFKLGVRDAKVGLVNPAVQGTQQILKACQKAPHVKKCIMTSCAVATCEKPDKQRTYTEEDWNTDSAIDHFPYHFAKTEAEKQAWETWKKMPQTENKFDFITMLPTMVIGPILTDDALGLNTSLRIIQDLMRGLVPFIPKMGLALVDVRDVALAHVVALQSPKAAGRYILHTDTLWTKDAVEIMKPKYKKHRFPSSVKSKFFVRRNETFANNMPFQYIRPWLGKWPQFSNTKSRRDLGLTYTPIEKSLIDMCASFEEKGI